MVRREPQPEEAAAVELQLAALWRDVLLLDAPIARDDDFFALGGDSLHLVQLCASIAETFDVDVQPSEVIGSASLGAMAALVAAGAHATGARPVLVPLAPGDDGRLGVYVVPGIGGTIAGVSTLIGRLEPGRRVLGFEAPGLYAGERPFRWIDPQARSYADAVLADTGDRPFALLGWSFGAVVIHEMARHLAAAGRPPALLVMVDGSSPGWERRRPLLLGARRIAVRVLRRPPGLAGPGSVWERIAQVETASRRAAAWHRPRPVDVPVVMITSTEFRARVGDDSLGWAPFLRGPVSLVPFDARHDDVLGVLADDTARTVDRALAAHDPVGAR